MYVQNEIAIKWTYMFSYFDQFSYPDCNLVFDDFLFLEIIQHYYFGYLYSQCYRLNIKLK